MLIGMSGVGKSTIGHALATRLSRRYIDTDAMVVEDTGRPITEIFQEEGEAQFRCMEHDQILKASQSACSIIATGGGAVLNPKNMKALKLNGIVIFLNRSVEAIIKDIDSSVRPLLKRDVNHLYKLYDARIELYKGYADIEVKNEKAIDDVVNTIIELINKTTREAIDENTCD